MGVADGRYTAIVRLHHWIVRAPDGTEVKQFGMGAKAESDARKLADRLNEKLRAVDGR